jgi:predicted flap endonuclease-1-like 5' DNA nuclease
MDERIELDPEEAARITALVLFSVILVAGTAVRAYWPSRAREPWKPPVIARPLSEAERYVLGEAMDLNRAAAIELELLPGIGPALASRIAAERPFSSFAEVDRVRGVGPKLLAGLEEHAVIRAAISRRAPPDDRARR